MLMVNLYMNLFHDYSFSMFHFENTLEKSFLSFKNVLSRQIMTQIKAYLKWNKSKAGSKYGNLQILHLNRLKKHLNKINGPSF